MATITQTRDESATRLKQNQPSPGSAAWSSVSLPKGAATACQAWIAKGPGEPMALETVDLGPLGAEEVDVAVEHSGLCHSDVSILNNEWGISQYPAGSRP